MLTVLTQNGIQSFQETCLFHTIDNNTERDLHTSLLLAYSNTPFPYSLYLASPLLFDTGCFRNKILLGPEALKDAFLRHISFDPLRSAVERYQVADFTQEQLSLLVYFYLNPLPFSITMIARWFTDSGTNAETASELAGDVFIARSCRDDAEIWFVNNTMLSDCKALWDGAGNSLFLNPGTPGQVLRMLQEAERIICQFDSLELNSKMNQKHSQIVNMESIDECSYLIEDHSVIVAGLATTVTDISRMTEDRWPDFHKKLLDSVPVSVRDFYSTGRLMIEKPEILLSLKHDHFCRIELISLDSDGKTLKTSIEDFFPDITHLDNMKSIPLFLQIIKPD